MTRVLAVVLAAVATALIAGRPANPLIARLGSPTTGRQPPPIPKSPTDGWRSTITIALLGAAAGASAGAIVVPPGGAVIGAVAAPAVVLHRARARARSARQARASEVSDACLALASRIRAGSLPEHALADVAEEWPELLGPAAARAAVGGDPAIGMRSTADRPGAAPLSAVAAAWEVSGRTGAPLSATLVAVADSMRTEATVRQEAEAQLATVRTTARLLALLPFGALLLFSTGGGEPVEFLLRTPYGLACLAGALVFAGAGLAWVSHTSRLAVTSPWGN